ncbi:MAG TPA: hypothetical protein PLE28_02475 [bacterium]|nr:hypothetical protein [bacterium]
MKFIINYNQVGNYKVFLRRAGYAFIIDRRRGVESFVRRLGDGYYPRIHLYVEESSDNLIFNLHLDQKKASYEGTHMHSAEYDGDIVSNEVNYLKQLLGLSIENNVNLEDNRLKDSQDLIETIKEEKKVSLSGNLDKDSIRLKKNGIKKKFWFFNR